MMNIFNRKKKIILYALTTLVVGLVIATLAWAYYTSMNKDDDKSVDNSNANRSFAVVCKDDLLKRADSAISSGNQVDMQTLASEVKNLPDYDRDPNCLYIVLSERLSVSDTSASRGYFDDMEPLVRASNGFSQSFIRSSPNLDTLRSAVVALESNQTQLNAQAEFNSKSFQNLDEVDKANSSEGE